MSRYVMFKSRFIELIMTTNVSFARTEETTTNGRDDDGRDDDKQRNLFWTSCNAAST